MVDYPHTRGGSHQRRTRAESPGQASAIWAGISLVMLAMLGWLWLRQAPADEPLPPRSTPAATAPSLAEAKPAGLVVQVVKTTLPPSSDVAAVGDTRLVRP